MKKNILIAFGILSLLMFFLGSFGFGELGLGGNETILNVDSNNALDTYDNKNPITNPIREGAYKIVDSNERDTSSEDKLKGIFNKGTIDDHPTALSDTLIIIKNLINYSLGLLSLISLIYLIYHGMLMLTAVGDDTQYKNGMKGLKTAMIAISGIGLSWIIISFIFWLINYITTTK